MIRTSGLEAVSLRRVAAMLGVTAPALYAYVTDKNDLLRSVAEVEFDQLMQRFEAIDETDAGRAGAFDSRGPTSITH